MRYCFCFLLLLFTSNCLAIYNSDIDGSGRVDFNDLACLSSQWLQYPGHEPIITSNVENGNLINIVKTDVNSYSGYIEESLNGGYEYWYLFKAENVLNKEMTFRIENHEYSHYPVFSYDDGDTWERMGTSIYRTFTHTPSHDTVLYAFGYPVYFSKLIPFIETIENSEFTTIDYGRSVQGRCVPHIVVTDPCIPDENKKVIFILASHHSGENLDAIIAQGILETVTEQTLLASILRQNCVFHFFPMLNPDGLVHGSSRKNINNQDLNREYDDLIKEPEVEIVMQCVEDLLDNGGSIDLAMDFHDSSITSAYHSSESNIGTARYNLTQDFIDIIITNTAWDARREVDINGTCKYYFRNKADIALTMEYKFNGQDSLLTTDQLKYQGYLIAETIAEFYNIYP